MSLGFLKWDLFLQIITLKQMITGDKEGCFVNTLSIFLRFLKRLGSILVEEKLFFVKSKSDSLQRKISFFKFINQNKVILFINGQLLSGLDKIKLMWHGHNQKVKLVFAAIFTLVKLH